MTPSKSIAVRNPQRRLDTPLRRAQAAVPNEKTLEATSQILDSVADPTRLRLMLVLASCDELCVSDLADVTHTVESTTSHALRVLRAAGLVRTRRQGRIVYYRLADEHVAHMIHDVVEHASRCGTQR